MGWLQISAQTLGKPCLWALHGAPLGPRCACRPSHWPWPPAIAQGCYLASHSCQAWAITPRAPSADRLCASERREQKTRWHSLKPRGQYGCSAVKSGHPAAWLPSHCPRFMPCTRCAETNRPGPVTRIQNHMQDTTHSNVSATRTSRESKIRLCIACVTMATPRP